MPMPERDAQEASKKSPVSSYPFYTPQNQESGWMMAFKALFCTFCGAESDLLADVCLA
jgi:hypothetical protein